MKLPVTAKVNLSFAIGIVLLFVVSIVALGSISSLVESVLPHLNSRQIVLCF